MSERKKIINHLLERIEELSLKQSDFNLEIYNLRCEIIKIQEEDANESSEIPLDVSSKAVEKEVESLLDAFVVKTDNDSIEKLETDKAVKEKQIISEVVSNTDSTVNPVKELKAKKEDFVPEFKKSKPNPRYVNKPPNKEKFSNWEDFLGRNLIGKLAIFILLLGLGFLTKHVIENQLINELTRIIIGYGFSLTLVFLALKWKPKYEQLSAIVLVGAISALFFITYAAYDYYDLIGQKFAFILMLVFTTFGMFSSHIYNKKALAYISIIGSFAIPLLLSNNSGNYKVLFTYLLILDTGILVFGLYKKWLGIALGSFLFSWVFYVVWFLMDYEDPQDFYPAWIFSFLFFALYYIGFVRYYLKVKFNKKIKLVVTALVIGINSFIFFLYGYSLLHQSENFGELKGLYTLINALIHFGVFYYVKKQNNTDKTLFYVIAGLVITFITIAVPVQLDGYFVTLIWFIEGCILFFIGRSKQLKMFELFTYPIILVGLFSLLDDWVHYSNYREIPFRAILNEQFLSNALSVVAFGVLTFFAFRWPTNFEKLKGVFRNVFLLFLVLLGYNLFFTEIGNYFALKHYYDMQNTVEGTALDWFHKTWKITYTLFYISFLFYLNQEKYKNKIVKQVLIGVATFTVFMYLTVGLYAISEIREDYIEYSQISFFSLMIVRYVSILALALVIYLIRNQIENKFFVKYFQLIIHAIILWVLSSELINWLDIANSASNYRFGLTILWGVYALLFLIYQGIRKKEIVLRIGGFILFGITLIKLFLYDLHNLGTIQKTIAFMSVGLLLLIVSYLYNRNKTALFGDDEKDNIDV